jgi:hypothetical protein
MKPSDEDTQKSWSLFHAVTTFLSSSKTDKVITPISSEGNSPDSEHYAPFNESKMLTNIGPNRVT